MSRAGGRIFDPAGISRSLGMLLEDFLEAVFPWKCPLCGGGGAPPAGLCAACLGILGAAPSWRCRSCGAPLAGTADCCAADRPLHLDGLLACADYTPPSRALVHLFKYRRRAVAGRAMGVLLAGAAERLLDVPLAVIVPVPLAPVRQRGRGFNQAALLARRLGRAMATPVAFHLLERSRETPPQADLPPDGRRMNIAGAFAIVRGALPPEGAALLVDDVYTTGTTMNECARIIKGAGAAAVFGAVFACARSRFSPQP